MGGRKFNNLKKSGDKIEVVPNSIEDLLVCSDLIQVISCFSPSE